MLNVDRLRAEQAVGNLVDNALRHGEGRIVVEARRGGDGTVELHVRDAGPGFPRTSPRARSSRSAEAMPRARAGRGPRPRDRRRHRPRPRRFGPRRRRRRVDRAAGIRTLSRGELPLFAWPATWTRRGSLTKLGGAHSGGAGWKALDQASGRARGGGLREVSCVLTPEPTEGPFFLPGDKVRGNVTEGKPGAADAQLTVLDVSTCKPIKGAAVDIWHCDAVGKYAAATNQTFLRGIQRTDAKGVATFKTLYPGWYRGRTVHIHVKVSLGGDVVHTGQLFFPDAPRTPFTSGAVRRGALMRNADDSIYRNGGSRSTLKLQEGKERLHGLDHHGRPALASRL